MAVTQANKTSGTSTADVAPAGTYSTASITPTADRLVLAAVCGRDSSSTPTAPTLTGNGLTWVQITTVVNTTAKARLTLYRAMGASPSAGVVTITNTSWTNHRWWCIDEFAGIDTGGTNGSGAIVQSATNNADTVAALAVTLAAFTDVDNATYGAMLIRTYAAITEGTGFTEIADLDTTESTGGQVQWRNDNDTSVDWSWTGNQDVAGLAVEIAAAGGTPLAPAAPTSAAATADGDSITATFTDNSSGAAQHRAYIKRSTDSVWTWAADLALGITTFDHEWLVADTSYDIGFTSFDADAESAMTTATVTTGTVRLVSGSFL